MQVCEELKGLIFFKKTISKRHFIDTEKKSKGHKGHGESVVNV